MSQIYCKLGRRVTKEFTFNYLLHLPLEYENQKGNWPLILFLHGIGQCGDDLALVKQHGVAKIVERDPAFPFIVVSPQCPVGEWWSSDALIALLDEVEKRYRVDKSRVYLTGLSMGGHGAWQLATDYPERFAAIAPICGAGIPILAPRLKELPVWAFHGAKDKIIPLIRSRDMVNAIRKAGGNVKFTVYPKAAHDSWTQTYENKRLYRWFLQHRRSRKTSDPL